MLHHMLLIHAPDHWKANLHTHSPTHLWFGCHDGTGVQLTPLNPADSSSSSRRTTASASAGPWYLDSRIGQADRLDLLLLSAVAAAGEQGAACIRGQLQHAMSSKQRHTATAAAATRMAPAVTHTYMHGRDQQQQQQQQASSSSSIIGQLFQRAVNTCLVLLLVFAAGRFWPQLSGLFQSPSTNSNSAAAAAAASRLPEAPPPPPAAAGGPHGLKAVPDKLTISSPPPSLPSAPTTPARLITASLESQIPTSGFTGPLGLNPGYPPSGLNPGLGAYSSSCLNPGYAGGVNTGFLGLGSSAQTTAASIDQLQMDNAQLAELVTQLHSEVGGSKAAAADASAAVRRQQVGSGGDGWMGGRQGEEQRACMFA
jgi:hypothetical protein